MVQDNIGDWRRTQTSSSISDLGEGQKVTIMGWISSIRDHRNLVFVMLNDKDGEIQVTAKTGECSDEIKEKLRNIKEHSCIAVVGSTKSSSKAPNGLEIVPQDLRVLSEVELVPPFSPRAQTVPNIDTRLEIRAVDLRRKAVQDVFLARTVVLKAIREYFYEHDFVEVNTPKMIATATEGGAALFPIFYYNKEAFLAQSPQLYKEQLTMSFEKVFEIAPIFRAEPSRTNRHLSEAISVDMEEAYIDYNDAMTRIEDIVRKCIEQLSDFVKTKGRGLQLNIPELQESIPRYSYSELVDRIQKSGESIEWGDDLESDKLKKIGMKGFYFVKDWPTAPKPFYAKSSEEDPKISETFDLMFDDLEVSSGGTRIEKRQDLEERMKKKGMKIESFDYHLKVFDYGVPPHAGWGMGLERLVMALTGTENIRDTTFYPRDVDRLTP